MKVLRNLPITRVWRNGGITSRGQILLFSQAVARVENVLEAATAPSPKTLGASAEKRAHKRLSFIYLHQRGQDTREAVRAGLFL